MDRRELIRLLALAPLALVFKPKQRKRYNFLCRICGVYVGHADWPMRVDRVGETYCVEHAVVHPYHEPGKSLVTGYHFGVEPGWEAYRESCGIRT